MKKTLILLISIFFSLTINGQNKEELISIMNEYSENYGKPNYKENFIIEKLNPTILKVEELSCKTKDFSLLNTFLKMLSKTKNSTDKFYTDILGGIFICNPEPIHKYLTQIYREKYFKDILKTGFENKTLNKKQEIGNYEILQKKLDRLIKTE